MLLFRYFGIAIVSYLGGISFAYKFVPGFWLSMLICSVLAAKWSYHETTQYDCLSCGKYTGYELYCSEECRQLHLTERETDEYEIG